MLADREDLWRARNEVEALRRRVTAYELDRAKPADLFEVNATLGETLVQQEQTLLEVRRELTETRRMLDHEQDRPTQEPVHELLGTAVALINRAMRLGYVVSIDREMIGPFSQANLYMRATVWPSGRAKPTP